MKSRNLGLEFFSYLVHVWDRHLGEEWPQTDKETLAQSPFSGHFKDEEFLHCLL
jgi:hypothetical protein